MERIVLAKGSIDTPEREAFVRRICGVYPEVTVEERLDVPHNRIEVDEEDVAERLALGKRTLVFGEMALKSAVRVNSCPGGMYPYARFFSVYGLCPHACSYCYLNGSPSTSFSPGVKVYVNLPEIISEIDRQANAAGAPMAFYLGKMQDGLALDPLTSYSTVLAPFFAQHRFARQVIQTKSANVERLLGLEHNGRTAVSWTLTPPDIAARYELNAPGTAQRIEAMMQCAKAAYPVCVNVAPIIPEEGWEGSYLDLMREIVARMRPRRFFFGSVCLDGASRSLLVHRLGPANAISRHLVRWSASENAPASYRAGYADRFFRKVMKVACSMGPCLFELDHLNGGSLVVRFGRNGCFDVFPECADESSANGSGMYGRTLIPTSKVSVLTHHNGDKKEGLQGDMRREYQ